VTNRARSQAETTTTLRGDAGNTPVSVSLAAALSLAEASSLDPVYDKQLAHVIANLAPVHREVRCSRLALARWCMNS